MLLAWDGDAATLWVHNTADSEVIFRKLVSPGEDIEVVDGVGTAALIVTDIHIVQTPQRRLAARSVLLWYVDDRRYRLEADMTRTELTELTDLARSLG